MQHLMKHNGDKAARTPNFLDLPPELRPEVYRYYVRKFYKSFSIRDTNRWHGFLPFPHSFSLCGVKLPALFQNCHLLRAELRDLYFEKGVPTFAIQDSREKLNISDSWQRRKIEENRHLRLHFEAFRDCSTFETAMAIYQNDQVMRDRFDNLFDLLSLAAVARRGEEAYAKYANLSQARRTLMIDFGHLFCLSTRAGAVTTESPTEEFELRKLTDESPNDNEISLSSVDPVNW